ncbi:unnamed protein product [Owenia fusiformis]|uniref:Poly [ADP-ribose] polymerase n=1 Tax=Owenia fusiformis TaxID=6347 RepID=A0A8J1Y4P9_OWEFU|nr:unnamed protein product [Owenia fusiformis]
MSDDHDYGFKGEYAKSDRSSCKSCKEGINKDTLRLAIMVQSAHFDGKVPNWFHVKCFWKRARVKDVSEIHGYDGLRWEDQKKLKDQIGGASAGGGGDAGGAATGPSGNYKDYVAEYAKSGASTCRGCKEKIAKNEVRLSKKDYTSSRAVMYGPMDQWYHVDCFADARDELDFDTTMQPERMQYFIRLKKEDRDYIIEKLGKGDKRKASASAKGATPAKKQKITETPEEKTLREQSQLLWKIRDELSKSVSNNAMKVLLEYNKQDIPPGESRLLDRVSDCMAFGALKPCTECKKGQLVYGTGGYKCSGNMTEWTKCLHTTREPQRKPFRVPKEFHDVEFLKKYKYVERVRAFPKLTSPSSSQASSSASFDTVDSAGASEKPLFNMKFVIIGKTSLSKNEITASIAKLGGTVVSKIDKKIVACISTKDEVAKCSKKIQDAKKADVHVISEDFINAVEKGGALLMIQQHSIASWGSDPMERIEEKPVFKSLGKSLVDKKSEAQFTKNVATTMKMKVKGGAAVDPDSGLSDKAHVLNEKDNIYNAILGMVDIVRGTNSYYKLQILEADKGTTCWVFRAWGRVGTTIGGNKTERYSSKAGALSQFLTLYSEKTGNDWEDRKNFVKHPNRFYPLDIDYGEDEVDDSKNLKLKSKSSSKLPVSVQDLVRILFDVEQMKKAMLEFEIDLKKMPLGKISKSQIEKAYKVLTELQNLCEKGGTPTKFLDASNRFYTLIPHDFGMKKPPLLDSSEIIKKKTEMIDNLLEIEVAYNLLKGGSAEKDPIDNHYDQLKTKIEPLDHSSEEYQRLLQYVANTHATTHNMYDLEVQEIFKVQREGEAKRYKPFKALPNRKLLWHGSRSTNFAGILSQGLRIAPPEAPVTGYMFGKGIYFADMVSKSANYCRTSKSDPIGLLGLCEVALGNQYELRGAEYVTSLPKGKHSTKGLGMTCPDPSEAYTTPDGVEIPMGKGMSAPIGRSSLLYNEFIVYDVAQVSFKYLLKVNFKYKW